MPFVDFATLKARVSIEQAAQMLGLALRPAGKQFRAPCPACKSGGDRALVVTPERGLFYCFSAKAGGDLITLVSHVQGCGQNEAALLIDRHFGGTVRTVPRNSDTVPRSSTTVPQGRVDGMEKARELKPLDYLQPVHEAVQALGVSEATCRQFGAGYAPKGIMRGRLAIPIHSRDGVLLAYCGRAVREESPTLLFPNGFDPAAVIFGADRVQAGPLILVRDPLQVLKAHESGVENVVAFLTEAVAAQQLEMLAGLMDTVKCESLELF